VYYQHWYDPALYSTLDFCRKWNISTYPTLINLNEGFPSLYSGPFEIKNIVEFVIEKTGDYSPENDVFTMLSDEGNGKSGGPRISSIAVYGFGVLFILLGVGWLVIVRVRERRETVDYSAVGGNSLFYS
jgi:hypothetical protein